jgi:hypothetical protein
MVMDFFWLLLCSGREKEYVGSIKSWTMDKLEAEWKRLDQMYHAKSTDVDVAQRKCTLHE